MAIKVNARETELKIGKNPGYYYVMTPELYLALNQKKVIKEAALRSGVSQGVMQACWDAAGEVIKAWATEGHSVALPGLGTIRFAVRAQAAKLEKVGVDLIKSKRIVFTPSVDIKKELAATSINITCIDRDGNIVKRITTDGGDVEDGEDENGSSGSSSGTSQTPETLSAPTISGDTTFSESSQVSISAADGAEIRYTLDGSTPTAESTLYSEAFTVTETTSVKAIAIKDGQTSEVASKTFVKSSGEGGMDQN
jgi:predicted histone-like DNA-binding protein